MTYEEYLEWDREYRIYEAYIDMKVWYTKYMESVDKDDMEYPPVEYWESGV
jgi:hypothetical protein